MESKKVGNNKTIYSKNTKKKKSLKKDNETEIVYKKGFRPKIEKKEQTSTLFNNPMVDNALKSMNPEQRERYRVLGEELYGKIDFVDSKILDKIEDPIEENAAIISESIKSGLHPSFLDNNEKEIIKSIYGENWYKHFGYDSLEF